MGISSHFAPLIIDTVRTIPRGGRIMTLGRQSLDFDAAVLKRMLEGSATQSLVDSTGAHPLTQEQFFEQLGFATVHSLDTSDYEGATHVFDLNQPSAALPSDLHGAYDIVMTGGTLEHVFDFPTALWTTLSMVKIGGLVVHLGPMHNYVDHGFYQFSPTIFFDVAAANKWVVLESVSIGIEVEQFRMVACNIAPLPPGKFGTVGALDGMARMHYFVARRDHGATVGVIPKQSYYASMHGESVTAVAAPRSFVPYRSVKGVRFDITEVEH